MPTWAKCKHYNLDVEVFVNLELVRTMTREPGGDFTRLRFDEDHSIEVIQTPKQIMNKGA
jgi:hypothetical protein